MEFYACLKGDRCPPSQKENQIGAKREHLFFCSAEKQIY